MRLKLLAGAAGLMGLAAAPIPAAAAVLALDFNPSTNYTSETVSSSNQQVMAYGWEFTTGASALTVTGLGTFDNGSLNNLGQQPNNQGVGPGDMISLYAGTIGSNNSTNGLTPLAQITIGGNTQTSGLSVSQVGAWAFGALSSSVTLAANSSFFILTTYGIVNHDPVAVFPSTVTVNLINLTEGIAEYCQVPATNCSLDPNADPGIFGPDFEVADSATPLPGALPLFASGLGVVALLMRRKKRNSALAA